MGYKKITLSLLFILGSIFTSIKAQTVQDVDGNIYKTMTIGTQTWMAQNLKTTKYRNGDLIGTTSPATLNIRNQVTPKYQWPSGGKESNIEAYGRLYTWYSVTDSRGICPVGWHIPTDAEWSVLINFLGGDMVAYSKLREAEEYHWIKYDAGTNESGFTALPGGIRNSNGSFVDIGNSGCWWSATENNSFLAWYLSMTYDEFCVHRYIYLKRNGLSVRCIKSNP